MDPADAIAALQALEVELARLHAVQAELLVAAASGHPVVEELLVSDPRPGHDEERLIRIADAVREEVAAALRWSPSVAQARIDAARLLCGPLRDTKAALESGQISPRHAAEVVEAAGRLPGRLGRDDVERAQFERACSALQAKVLPVAARGTVSQARAAARRAVLAIDAQGQARRRDEARATRDVYVVDELDGISTLVARLATEQAHAVLAAVDAAAHGLERRGPGGAGPGGGGPAHTGLDRLRIGQRRADALVELVLAGGPGADATGEESPRAGRRPVEVRLDVVVGLDQLLGDDPDGGVDLRVRGGRYVPSVSLATLCALLDDPEVTATMRRLVVDPGTGHLLDVGRRSYAIPAKLREFIALRDRTCRFPGCGRRADHCQVDHALAWDDGGSTDPPNLGALCVRHHQLKTHGGWDIVASSADGGCTWTSPQGRSYHRHPVAV